MPFRGSFNLNWPWQWLKGEQLPGEYQVPKSVQPVVDIGRHWDGVIQGYREQFVMALGLNTVVLPGFNRASSLNAAPLLPVINGIGARRWLGLAYASDTAMVGGEDVVWAYGAVGANWTMMTEHGGGLAPANRQRNVIRGSQWRSESAQPHGQEASLLVPDPNFLFFTVANQAGGEVLTVSGVFIETEDRSQPLPDPFAP